MLFPVRIETRFVTDGNGPQLLVRIYPDEIHIDTHETALTKEEVDAGMAYQVLLNRPFARTEAEGGERNTGDAGTSFRIEP